MWAFPPRRIVVAVDFGEPSGNAVTIAGSVARRFAAALVAIHAETIEAPVYFLADQVRSIEQQRRAARASATDYLQLFVSRRTDVPVHAHIADGPAAEAVLSASLDSDLLVMGTHGRRGPSRWWAGSVAERVVRSADVPVLVVRGGAVADPFRRIGVIGGSRTSDEAARHYAEGLAVSFRADPPRLVEGAAAASHREEVSLLVVPQPATRPIFGLTGSVEHLLRSSDRAALFVPSV